MKEEGLSLCCHETTRIDALGVPAQGPRALSAVLLQGLRR